MLHFTSYEYETGAKEEKAREYIYEMQKASTLFLNREDAYKLCLPLKEIEEWGYLTLRKFTEAQAQRSELLTATNPENELAAQFLSKLVLEVVNQMITAIFTPERIHQLLVQLRQYRDKREAAGDRPSTFSVERCILSLEHEKELTTNLLLITLCYLSLQSGLTEIAAGGTDSKKNNP